MPDVTMPAQMLLDGDGTGLWGRLSDLSTKEKAQEASRRLLETTYYADQLMDKSLNGKKRLPTTGIFLPPRIVKVPANVVTGSEWADNLIIKIKDAKFKLAQAIRSNIPTDCSRNQDYEAAGCIVENCGVTVTLIGKDAEDARAKGQSTVVYVGLRQILADKQTEADKPKDRGLRNYDNVISNADALLHKLTDDEGVIKSIVKIGKLISAIIASRLGQSVINALLSEKLSAFGVNKYQDLIDLALGVGCNCGQVDNIISVAKKADEIIVALNSKLPNTVAAKPTAKPKAPKGKGKVEKEEKIDNQKKSDAPKGPIYTPPNFDDL